MTSKIDLTQFKKTEVIKKLSKSKSDENLKEISDIPNKGRKSKYNTPEERLEARKQQKKEYRQRKKQELEEFWVSLMSQCLMMSQDKSVAEKLMGQMTKDRNERQKYNKAFFESFPQTLL